MQAGPKTRKSSSRGVPALLAPAQASRTLMVLGLLKSGAKHGYELHRIVVAHGSLYPDFKKPTLYHLLHRLTLQGAVQVRPEAGARGPRGERLVFTLAPKGETLFMQLLRNALSSYDASHTGFEVATAFLGWLPAAEAQLLLHNRLGVIRLRRAEVAGQIEAMPRQPEGAHMAALQLATDHSLMLLDAEIAWADRAIRRIGVRGPAALTERNTTNVEGRKRKIAV
ncbi:MAG: PadR family transcriptional regulator [Gammaproteobacteria bacterium]|nr:PadR family transcriptional regulator [Gammaproteobacteria bacterium]